MFILIKEADKSLYGKLTDTETRLLPRNCSIKVQHIHRITINNMLLFKILSCSSTHFLIVAHNETVICSVLFMKSSSQTVNIDL